MVRILSFRNRQRTRALAVPALRRLTRQVLEQELGVMAYELGVHFVEPDEMARVNQQFLQHEGSTDVITFDHADLNSPENDAATLHGEIFISVADAVKQAKEFGTTWQSEVARYLIHGLLHLRGYDDLQPTRRRVMKREENRLLENISALFVLHSLSRSRHSSKDLRQSPR